MLGSGNTLTDSATLSDGSSPTGTITFTLYAPNGTTVVDTETAPVNGNGTYPAPAGYTPTSPGTYQWVASYSGDANNNAIPNTTEGNEPEIVSLASPTLITTPGGTIVLGSANKLSDSATLAGGYNTPTGTITFTLYAPDGEVVDTATDTVSGNNTYDTPSGYTPTAAGTYQWVASYSGDANNNPVPSDGTGSEPEIGESRQSPTLTTTPGANGRARQRQSAHRFGDPVGRLLLRRARSRLRSTPPTARRCLTTQTATVNGNGTYTTPAGYTPTAPGTYQWVASYSGDANNNPVSTTTEGNEPEIVSLASPTLMTTAGGTVVLGSGDTLNDSATLAGGYNPTGTITFTLYAANGSVVDTETDTVNSGNDTYNTPTGYTPTVAGTYQWVASYSGDANNNPVASTKGSEPETVSPGDPDADDDARRDGRDRQRSSAHRFGDVVGRLRHADGHDYVHSLRPQRHDGGFDPNGHGQRQRHLHHARRVHAHVARHLPVGRQLQRRRQQQPNPHHDRGERAGDRQPRQSDAESQPPGGTIVLGSGNKLSDSATLAGGYNLRRAPSRLPSTPRMPTWWTPKRPRSTATTPTTRPAATRPRRPAPTSGSPATAATPTTTRSRARPSTGRGANCRSWIPPRR